MNKKKYLAVVLFVIIALAILKDWVVSERLLFQKDAGAQAIVNAAEDLKETGELSYSYNTSGSVIKIEEEAASPFNRFEYYALENSDDEIKTVYLEIVDAIEHLKEDVELSTLDKEQVHKAFQCVMMDHPEYFWNMGYKLTPYTRDDQIVKLVFSGNYTMDSFEKERMQKQIEEVAKKWALEIPEEASDYEKVKAVYEKIILNTDYNEEAENNQNICSVFLEGESVCQGYAYAFHYMMKRLGIPCVTVNGTSINGMKHAWNLVLVENAFYWVDCTWGDPNYQIQNADVDDVVSNSGLFDISYDYLCITSEEIEKNHIAESEVPLPKCTAKTYNYYVREEKYYTECNVEQIKKNFSRAYEKGEPYLVFKAATNEVYKEMTKYFFEDGKVFSYLKKGEKAVYIQSEEQQMIWIFLK